MTKYDPDFRFSGKPRVLFARPRMYNKPLPFLSTQPPLNLAMLGAVVRRAGGEARIIDLDVQLEKDFEAALREFEPDALALTAMTPQIPGAYGLAGKAGEICPSTKVIIGGPHVSALPERTLEECPGIDCAIAGEGELPLLSALDGGFEEKILRSEPIENLDDLPGPARDLLPMQLYRGQSYRGFSRDVMNLQEILTARGCPASCIFCACGVVHGRGVHERSVESVEDEVKNLVRDFGARHLVVLDDTFNANRGRAMALAEVFKKAGATFNVTMRARGIDFELAKHLFACGCTGAAIGVEAGSAGIRKLIGKGASDDDIAAAFDALHRARIKNIEADFMIGSHPDESDEDIRETEKLIRDIRPNILFLSVAVPLPGTRLREMMLKDELLSDDIPWNKYLFFGEPPPWRTKHFTGEELIRRQRRILRRYLFSARSIVGRLRRIASVRELRYYISAGFAFLGGRS
ncbi:MAG: B12-binding domain-containing radical SAM protein [Planctomycetota bacterium]|jgi:radical SAM superfamily enzyme YgiQ (UPF0313 family)